MSWSTVKPDWVSVRASSRIGRLHVHSTRARRCAITQRTELAIRNGSMPISTRREMELGASFVCNVDRRRCPVNAASMLICAVSRSRISPTMMMSGSARIIDRSPVANVSPERRLTATWVTPSS